MKGRAPAWAQEAGNSFHPEFARTAAIPCLKTAGKPNLQMAHVVSMNETADETNDKRWRGVALCVSGHSDFVCGLI
jgi:hypothetical protein